MPKILSCLCLLLFATFARAQQYSFIPADMHLLTPEEKRKLVPPFPGVNFMMEDGTYLDNKSVAEIKEKGGYEQLFYGDAKGKVRFVVTRKLSEQEIAAKKERHDSLVTLSANSRKAMKGQPLPEFQFSKLDGTAVPVASFRGKSTLLYFWFTQCGECEKRIPDINRLARMYKDVQFYAPTLDNKGNTESFLAKKEFLPTPLLVSGTQLGEKGLNLFPTLILLDAQGNVLEVRDASDPQSVLKMQALLYRMHR